MDSARLPTLSPANQRFWKRTLQALAADLGLAQHLDPSTTAPADPEEFAKFKLEQVFSTAGESVGECDKCPLTSGHGARSMLTLLGNMGETEIC